jgi:hypothetical protein
MATAVKDQYELVDSRNLPATAKHLLAIPSIVGASKALATSSLNSLKTIQQEITVMASLEPQMWAGEHMVSGPSSIHG